jgi:hypothetical protein
VLEFVHELRPGRVGDVNLSKWTQEGGGVCKGAYAISSF